MSSKIEKRRISRIRFVISALISLGLATIALWGLVPISDPHAKLYTLNLRNVNENYSTIYLELELTNPNYFRGFNYTDSGWVELFYVSKDDHWQMTFEYNQADYQGFRKSLHWNFTMNITTRKLNWDDDVPLLKSHESHFYVSMYLKYWYKILLWTTETDYYQWLDTNVYFDNNFDLEGIAYFNRTKDFTLAIAT